MPLGGDVELYNQMGSWAPEIAGFLRFDLDYQTPGLMGRPGLDLIEIAPGDVVLTSYLFVTVPFDGTPGFQAELSVEGVGEEYTASFSVDALNDWQSYDYASVAEGLFGIRDPLLFRRPTTVRFYIADSTGGDPGSTQGRLTIVLRVLPAPAVYPAAEPTP